MRVAVRTDASSQIGLGHAMRCLALGQALAALGAEVLFVARHMPDSTAARIRHQGFELMMLEAADDAGGAVADTERGQYAEWLGVHWLTDAQQTLQVLAQKGRVDWLVVDHYALDERWESVVSAAANHVAVIDDLDDRPHYCDLLIDHNPSLSDGPRYVHNTPNDCLRLLGPRYALLRPEFAVARGDAPPMRNRLKRLLISFGGADPAGVTAHAMAALVPLAFEGFALDVVLGGASIQRAAVEKAVAAIPAAQLHVDVQDMTSLYLSADLAVGAAGTSVWERCTLGLPTILLTLADNQLAGAQALAEGGGCIHLGSATAQHMVAMTGLVRALAQSPDWLSILSRSAAAVCDGLGASRVAARMGFFAIELRRARVDEATLLRALHSRADNLHGGQADTEEQWAARVMDPEHIVLVAEKEGQSCGMVCLVRDGTLTAEISIFLDAEHVGLGMAAVVLALTERWLRANSPDIRQLRAIIDSADMASRRAFQQASYAEAFHEMLRVLEDER